VSAGRAILARSGGPARKRFSLPNLFRVGQPPKAAQIENERPRRTSLKKTGD